MGLTKFPIEKCEVAMKCHKIDRKKCKQDIDVMMKPLHLPLTNKKQSNTRQHNEAIIQFLEYQGCNKTETTKEQLFKEFIYNGSPIVKVSWDKQHARHSNRPSNRHTFYHK